MTNVTKMALEEHQATSAVTEGRTRRRLTSQWYKDAKIMLAIHWVIEVELDERRLPAIGQDPARLAIVTSLDLLHGRHKLTAIGGFVGHLHPTISPLF